MDMMVSKECLSKIDLNGNNKTIVQTAFDDNLKLVRQKSPTDKDILYDVKYPRKK